MQLYISLRQYCDGRLADEKNFNSMPPCDRPWFRLKLDYAYKVPMFDIDEPVREESDWLIMKL